MQSVTAAQITFALASGAAYIAGSEIWPVLVIITAAAGLISPVKRVPDAGGGA